MRVLSIGTDETIFEDGSPARMRQRSYASALGALHCIVLSKRLHPETRDSELSILCAAGSNRLQRLVSAYRLGAQLRDAEVVTVQDPFEVGFIGMLIARRLNVPLHVQLHTDPFDPDFARGHWPLNRIRLFLMRSVIRRAARIRVVSERVKRKLQERYGAVTPISVLPIYVDVQRFAAAEAGAELQQRFSRFEKKLLVVSRLEAEKNVALAIRSFAEAAPPESCLIILGDGSERESLRRTAEHWKVSDRVFFEGKTDPAPYYKLTDLMLVSSRYEGYGLVIVEALAAGTPVLSTDVGVAKEAGAIVADEEYFAGALAQWFRQEHQGGELKHYLYRDFDEYVRKLVNDIVSLTN